MQAKNKAFFQFTVGTRIILQPTCCFIYNVEAQKYDILNVASSPFLQSIISCRYHTDPLRSLLEKFTANHHEQIINDYNNIMDFLVARGYVKHDILAQNCEECFESLPPNITKVLQADIEITNQCNLSCKYCYAESKHFLLDAVLSGSEWVSILMSLYSQGLRAIKFSGGEPFMHPNFMEILDKCAGKFIISINSNGSFIDKRIAKALSKSNIQSIQISLDSERPAEHDMMRGAGSWKRAVTAIGLLREYGVRTSITATIGKHNVSRIEKIKKYANDMNVSYYYEVMKPLGRGENIAEDKFLDIASAVTKHNNVDKTYNILRPMNMKCQAHLGFIGLSHDGLIKPCNLTVDFFSKLEADVTRKYTKSLVYEESSTFQLIDKKTREAYFQKPTDSQLDHVKCILCK